MKLHSKKGLASRAKSRILEIAVSRCVHLSKSSPNPDQTGKNLLHRKTGLLTMLRLEIGPVPSDPLPV